MRILIMITLLLPGSLLGALNLQVFDQDSYLSILKHYQGQAFLMVLWSVDCPPCLQELSNLAKVQQSQPTLNMIFIATDGLYRQQEVIKAFQESGLQTPSLWLFSKASDNRLRYRIDPQWYGELPRSYFFNDCHQRQSFSGLLQQKQIDSFIQHSRC